jgi:hypothetical protein
MKQCRGWREDAAIRAMYWILLALLIGTVLMILARPAHADQEAVLYAPSPQPSPARGEGKSTWTTMDTSLEVVYGAFHVMDWSQTLHFVRNPERYYERNNILGRYPSEGRVNSYFALTLAGHAAVAYVLPKPWRTIWQSVWIGIEANQVNRNRELGVGISLHF